MNSDTDVVKDNGKKKRSRKKQLYQAILKQMEFYFSDANLSKDRFFSTHVRERESVDLNVFLTFNKIKALTSDKGDIVKALKQSEMLEVSEETMTVKRITPFMLKENPDGCTIYVEQLPNDADHDWLKEMFSSYGKVDYLSMPRFKNGKLKGFAFVEFATPEIANAVIEDYKKLGNYLSEMPPENLCSINTHENKFKRNYFEEEKEEEYIYNGPQHLKFDNDSDIADENPSSANPSSKRKLSDDDAHTHENVTQNKKMKNDDQEEDTSEKDTQQVETDEDAENLEEGRKKKHRKKKKKSKKDKITAENSDLQILSKTEWKRLRNMYLNMQREKMKVLKKHLSQKPYRTDKFFRDGVKKVMKTTKKEDEKVSLEYPSGVIVKWLSQEPVIDIKKVKDQAKEFLGMKFVDIKEGATEIFFRLESPESVTSFCQSAPWSELKILDGEEEQTYWRKIEEDRTQKFNRKKVKERGKSKLIRKAEKALGKHTVFEKLEDE